MIRLDKNEILVGGVSCFLVGRNEITRLPWFLAHHRSLGVARFFYVDNLSTDGSKEFMLRQPDVHVWQEEETYGESNGYGRNWQMKLVRKYAMGQWCLLLDADEAFVLPVGESIIDLVLMMDKEGSNMLRTNMIDCYSTSPIEQTSPSDCVWFDKPFSYNEIVENNIPVDQKNTRFRRRMFGIVGTCMVKNPLFKMNRLIDAAMGIHYLIGDPVCSKYVGAIIHAKYIKSFPHYVDDSVNRGVHWNENFEYKLFQKSINDLEWKPWDNNLSIKFESTEQLMEIGLMSVNGIVYGFSRNNDEKVFELWWADANNGSIHCMRDVAFAYHEGIGVKQDLRKSQLWQNKAEQTELGHFGLSKLHFKYFIILRFFQKFVEKISSFLGTKLHKLLTIF